MARVVSLVSLATAIGFALATTSAAQDRARNAPGDFDFYLLSLSWSPSFCETAKSRFGSGSSDQQCGKRPYAFVVHGLWPQYAKGFPESCQVPAPHLDRNLAVSMLDLMPAMGLIFHEWDSHGTCSGLGPRDYFDTVRRARDAVKIPDAYIDPAVPLEVAPSQVVDAFVKANEGLTPSGMAIDCDRTRLREVRICLSRDLHFRQCENISRKTCRSPKLVMPPVRGG